MFFKIRALLIGTIFSEVVEKRENYVQAIIKFVLYMAWLEKKINLR